MAQRDEDTALLKSAQLDLGRYQNLAKRASRRCSRWTISRTVDKQIARDRCR